MEKNKGIKFIIIFGVLILVITGIVLLNRDIMHFTYDIRLEREFRPEIDGKGNYILLGPISLKPGSYELTLELSMNGYQSAVFLTDGDENTFYFSDIPVGETKPVFPFEISGTSKQVRLGISYDPAHSSLTLKRIRIDADHVLYRDSILRHLVLSLLVFLAGLWLVLRLCFPTILWKAFPAFSVRQNEIDFVILLAITAAACFPLLDGNSYVRGEDMFFHLTRIRGLADSLQAGYFPVRNQLYWLHNYGYGVGFYYPDTFLYFPAVLLLLGFDVLTAYKVFLVACSFFSIASTWYAGLRISCNRTAAMAAAVFMAFASYRLSNVYYRGAVGETQAAMFYPLIILGLYEIFYGDRKRWWFFAMGFWGLLSCHMISLVMAAALTLLFLLTQVRNLIKEPALLSVLLRSVLVVVGLGAFFWMPMMEQSLTNPELRINNVLGGDVALNGTNYAFPVENLFSRFKPWNFAWQADCIYPGWSLLLIPLLAIGIWEKRDKLTKTADFLLLFSLPVIWMCTRAFPWQWKIFLPFVVRIQFAYRLLLPASVMLCLCGGIYFAKLVRKRSAVLMLGLLTLFCFFSTAFPVLQESVQNRTVDKRMFVMQDNRVSGAEYLPKGLDKDFPGKNADTVLLAETDIPLNITAHKREKLGFSFRYDVPESDKPIHFSVPLIYYTGYQGTLNGEDGTIITPEISWDERGLVSLSNENISRGTVTVRYQKTITQCAGELLTLISVCCLMIHVMKKRDDQIKHNQ